MRHPSTYNLEKPSAVIARTGVGKTSLYAMIKAGEFPKPIRLGERATAFLSHEVDQWIADRIAARDGATSNTTHQ